MSRMGVDDHMLHAVVGVRQGAKEIREVLRDTQLRLPVKEFGMNEIHASHFPKRENEEEEHQKAHSGNGRYSPRPLL
jgi:hypothetical protein